LCGTGDKRFFLVDLRRMRKDQGSPAAVLHAHAGSGDGITRMPINHSLKWLNERITEELQGKETCPAPVDRRGKLKEWRRETRPGEKKEGK
jgi:hypothetical protein